MHLLRASRTDRPHLTARRRYAALGVFVALAAAASEASATPVVPTIALSGITHGDRVELDVEGVGTPRSDRSTTALGLSLGLAYTLGVEGLPGDELRASSAIGLAVGSVRGDGRLVLRQDAAVTLASAGPFALRAGLGVDLHLGLAAPASSFADAALSIAVALGPVELAWRPALAIPLASRDEAVLGGERRQHVAPGFVPLAFELRVAIDALRF